MRLKSWCVAVVLLFGLAHSSLAQEKQEFTVKTVSGQSVRVHMAPDINSKQVGSIASGTTVPVVSVDGAWVQVKMANGAVGYVSKSLGQLKVTSPAAKPVESDPVQARAAVPSSNPVPPARAEAPVQAAQPKAAAPTTEPGKPGKLGAGITFVSAFAPSVMYDISPTLTVKGEVDIVSGAVLFAPQAMLRFPRPLDKDSNWAFEPYVSGGPILSSVARGFIVSGGSFIKYKKFSPNWRFGAEITFVQLSDNFESGAGIGVRTSVHYFFNQ